MKNVYLKKNEERRIKSGHLWVFSNELEKIEGAPENGDVVKIFDSRKNLLGSGFFNNNSLIAVRFLSNEIDFEVEPFLRKKINLASELRKKICGERNSYRLVFSESDFLPGLIIDKYNETFVLQIYCSGIEKNIEVIVDELKNLGAKNIFTKNDEYFRTLEKLPTEDKIYLGSVAEELIEINSIKYKIDFTHSQKTGFYFDQVDNRKYLEKIFKGKNVIDAFSNSGGFGLHAALSGASRVTFVDQSSSEIEKVRTNLSLNNFTTETELICSDVFDFFKNKISQCELFDIVMIDPPAFAKNKKTIATAIAGYEKLNKLGLDLVKQGGFLVTSSCSFHVKKEDFLFMLNKAAIKSNKSIQLLYYGEAAADHPKLISMPETSYLKFAVLAVG
ncbi:MAG: class I SAM-dependent rRNA methyltransferase [Chlorobiaceae bacterium]|nr:class I SAM-dependent rRNA methyltransferase [Chlorobiaceae bacterium]MBA4309972.1 class I SAM-dependent rRNA methyltransferase [Chlorobiaceae bacterium]